MDLVLESPSESNPKHQSAWPEPLNWASCLAGQTLFHSTSGTLPGFHWGLLHGTDKLDTGPELHANQCSNSIHSNSFLSEPGLPSLICEENIAVPTPTLTFRLERDCVGRNHLHVFWGRYLHLVDSGVRSTVHICYCSTTCPACRPLGAPCLLVSSRSSSHWLPLHLVHPVHGGI